MPAFSSYGHDAYQIKWNLECSKKVATILPVDRPLSPWGYGQKVKIKLFQNTVMLQIKLKGMTHAAT